jgi:CRISPR-associated protein Cpf1
LSEFCPEKEELFEKFKGFFTYFSNFNESRKNFYKDDGTASAIVTRIVDENLVTFIKNIQNFHKIEKIYPDFIEECFSEQEREIFSLDFYNSCLLQKGINKYNEVIG